MNLTLKLVALIGCAAFTGLLFAGSVEERVGKVYPFKGAVSDKPLFVQTIAIESLGPAKSRIESTTKDVTGAVVLHEVSRIEDGVIVEQQMDQLQVQERYLLTVQNGKVSFKTFTIGEGGEKLKGQASETLKENFVTGPATESYLLAQAGALSKGEAVKANLWLFEEGRSVEFEFRPRTRTPAGNTMKVRMEPASFWLNLMADPIELELDPATYRLTHYHGPTPLKVKTNSGWKPLDADIQFVTLKKL